MRRALDALHARVMVPGFAINSLPKAGTHLLGKALSLFPGVRFAGVQFDYSTAERFAARAGEATIPIGIDWPQPVSLASARAELARVGRGRFAAWHVPYSDEFALILAARGMNALLMLRDPRDVVVSHARFVSALSDHFLYPVYAPLAVDEQIMRSIRGVEPGLLDIGARCRSLGAWQQYPRNLTTAFEKIIGPQGGGSRAEQIAELARIAAHVGLRHPRARLETVADQMFGGTHTFRKGAIGAWRDTFTEAHKRAFKETAGDILVAWGYEQDDDW
jgi:hypothetical protein